MPRISPTIFRKLLPNWALEKQTSKTQSHRNHQLPAHRDTGPALPSSHRGSEGQRRQENTLACLRGSLRVKGSVLPEKLREIKYVEKKTSKDSSEQLASPPLYDQRHQRSSSFSSPATPMTLANSKSDVGMRPGFITTLCKAADRWGSK